MSQRGRKNWFQLFLGDESGQSTTEYILILSVIVLIALKFKETFKEKLLSAVEKVGTNIDRAVEIDE